MKCTDFAKAKVIRFRHIYTFQVYHRYPYLKNHSLWSIFDDWIGNNKKSKGLVKGQDENEQIKIRLLTQNIVRDTKDLSSISLT